MKTTIFFLFLACIVYSQDANQYIDSLKLELNRAQSDTVKAKILAEIIEECEIDQIKLYTAPLISLCEKNIAIIDKTNRLHTFYLKYKSDALINQGYYFKQKGEILEALNTYEEGLKEKTKIGDKGGEALVLNNIAMIYYNQGNISKALEYNSRSLHLQEQLNDKAGIANSLNNIAGIYDNQGDSKKALEVFQKSLKIREEIKDEEGIATSLTNIGFIYLSLGDTLKALECCNKTLGIHKKTGNIRGQAYDLNNLGFIYLNKGDITKAYDYYTKSLLIRDSIGDKQGLAYTYNNLARIFLIQKKYDLAIQYSSNSLKLSKELGFPHIVRDAALSLKKAYEKINNSAMALNMYELYIQMRDSINNLETKSAALKTQFKYDFEKREAILKEQQNKENLLAEERNKKKNFVIWSILTGLVLVVTFLIFVFNRLQITRKQKIIIEQQKLIVEEHQKDILDSINYAKRIQFALLASDHLLQTHLPEYFVLFNPKDVVSGDFYWATPTTDGFIYITADCTGHGVPGAFMSLLNISKLSQAINENNIIRPDLILNNIRTEIVKALNPEGSANESKDGMDAVLCKLNLKKMVLEYSAANNSFYILRNNNLLVCKADKMPVGKGHNDELSFTYNEIALQKGDIIYTFTDGFADQFGGEKGKKFMYKRLEETLLRVHTEPMEAQKQKLNDAFNNWKGDLEQVDDVCIIGVKIS